MSQTPISFPPAELTLREQIRVRAEHPETADKVFLMHDERRWSYRRFRDEATRVAHFVLGRLGASDEKRPPHVAMLLENHLELVALFGGCGIAGATLFGINTGLRGEVLAGVVNHSRARLVVVDDKLLPEVEREVFGDGQGQPRCEQPLDHRIGRRVDHEHELSDRLAVL